MLTELFLQSVMAEALRVKIDCKSPIAVITPKQCDIGCQLVLITNRKLHTGFRLAPTLMTLNGLEPRPFFTNSIALQADYVTVVKDRPIVSVKYCLPVPSST